MKIESRFPAILLAGGFGTRLRATVPGLPKPLAPVQGRPFITYLLDQLVEAGFTRAIICLHYHAEKVIETLGLRYRSLELDYSVETDPVGTGGALRLAITKSGVARYLVMNADSYCQVKLADFAAFHLAHDCPASLVSIRVEDTARYGSLTLATDGRVVALAEKDGASRPGPINGGIYLVEESLAKNIPEGRTVSLEREIFPLWLEKGFMAWQTTAPFIDIGVPETYEQAQSMEIFRAGPTEKKR